MARVKRDETVELLWLLVKISALQVTINSGSVTQGARALKLIGLDNQTIAEVLNTTPATVRTVTANLRVKKKKGLR
jgi:hypothetical protein